VRERAPALGEHTESILKDAGIAADQIARWREQGVIS
jgi:crotonobetainyl-CoA:carnitine CoA-transferase CaiB-like acyl-CoA transferase